MEKHKVKASQPLEHFNLTVGYWPTKALFDLLILLAEHLGTLVTVRNGTAVAVEVVQRQTDALEAEPAEQLFHGAKHVFSDEQQLVMTGTLNAGEFDTFETTTTVPFEQPPSREHLCRYVLSKEVLVDHDELHGGDKHTSLQLVQEVFVLIAMVHFSFQFNVFRLYANLNLSD